MPSRRRRRVVRLAAVLCAGVLLAPLARAADPVTVFAAASLTNAFEEVSRAFEAKGGAKPRFSFAASSALAKQIEAGAPAAIFASADEQWMDYLAQRRLILPDTRVPLLGNRLVLVVPAGNATNVDLRPGVDLLPLLGDRRLATGDPAHVPVGRYAQQALTRLGAWSQVEPRLVRADTVRAALALVERGEVAAGIVYSTDAAISKGVRVAGVFPEDSHAPIVYPIAIVAGNDSPPARDLFAFLRSPEATAIYRRYGFAVR